jgi:beta-galactosidase GanA
MNCARELSILKITAEHGRYMTHVYISWLPRATQPQVVCTFFTGIVDEHERVHLGGYPEPGLQALLGGVWVEEWAPLHDKGGQKGPATGAGTAELVCCSFAIPDPEPLFKI